VGFIFHPQVYPKPEKTRNPPKETYLQNLTDIQT
jgi:hypothetical protein